MNQITVTAVLAYIREFRDLHPVHLAEIESDLLSGVSTVREEFEFLELFQPVATDGHELREELYIQFTPEAI